MARSLVLIMCLVCLLVGARAGLWCNETSTAVDKVRGGAVVGSPALGKVSRGDSAHPPSLRSPPNRNPTRHALHRALASRQSRHIRSQAKGSRPSLAARSRAAQTCEPFTLCVMRRYSHPSDLEPRPSLPPAAPSDRPRTSLQRPHYQFPHHPQGNNPIKSIPNGAFTNLTKLRRLDLVRDALATLMPPCTHQMCITPSLPHLRHRVAASFHTPYLLPDLHHPAVQHRAHEHPCWGVHWPHKPARPASRA